MQITVGLLIAKFFPTQKNYTHLKLYENNIQSSIFYFNNDTED